MLISCEMYDRSVSGASVGLLERERDNSSSFCIQEFNPRQMLALIDELRVIKTYQTDNLSIHAITNEMELYRSNLRSQGYNIDNESELLKQIHASEIEQARVLIQEANALIRQLQIHI